MKTAEEGALAKSGEDESAAVRIPPSPSQSSPWTSLAGLKRNAPVIGFLLLVLAFWEFGPALFEIPGYIMPQLSDVLGALLDPSALPRYLEHARVTLTEAIGGLAIGTLFALVSAVVFTEYEVVHRIFYPYIVAIQSIPKVALAPLFVIALGYGMSSKIVVVILLSYFPVLVNTISGIRSVDDEHIELFRVNGASKSQLRWKLILPSALPSIFAGFEVAVVMSMLGAIVAEFVGAQAGLGLLIIQAQARLNTAAVFALLIILSIIGVSLNTVVRLLRRRVLFWIPQEAK